jgi:hypothetical protein
MISQLDRVMCKILSDLHMKGIIRSRTYSAKSPERGRNAILLLSAQSCLRTRKPGTMVQHSSNMTMTMKSAFHAVDVVLAWKAARGMALVLFGALTALSFLHFASVFDAPSARPAPLLMNEPVLSGPVGAQWDPEINPLAIPPGEAHPSIRVSDSDVSKKRLGGTKYGGEGDKAHLGGFTTYDGHGVSPYVWRQMMKELGVHSVVDVGCGRGISTTWFLYQGVDVLCVEGSHDAVTKTLLPDPESQVVEHDFSRGTGQQSLMMQFGASSFWNTCRDSITIIM